MKDRTTHLLNNAPLPAETGIYVWYERIDPEDGLPVNYEISNALEEACNSAIAYTNPYNDDGLLRVAGVLGGSMSLDEVADSLPGLLSADGIALQLVGFTMNPKISLSYTQALDG